MNSFENPNSIQLISSKPKAAQRPVLRQLNPNIPSHQLNLDIYDQKCIGNPQYLPDMAQDIYTYLQSQEAKFQQNPSYMSRQTEVSAQSRSVLVDWICQLHMKFRMLPETLFITVNILDRYLHRKSIGKFQLQLLGATALSIAAKYEEIYPPELREFLNMAEKAYSKDQMKRMETDMLNTLEFQLTFPTAWVFYERFMRLAEMDEMGRSLGRYLLELSLLDYGMLQYRPSELASAAVLVAKKLQNRNWRWNQRLLSLTGFSENELTACGKDLVLLHITATNCPLTTVYNKFSRPAYHEVAKFPVKC